MKDAEKVYTRAGIKYWFDEELGAWKIESRFSDLVFDSREDVREFIDDYVYYSYLNND